MKIPLPNLDDRRWADLVEEGRSLIPVFAPDWTDHNAHDPGITLMELLAWVAEMDIFQLNQITDRAKQKFLSMVGLKMRPPRAARTVLSLTLADTVTSTLELPAGIEFKSREAFGPARRFRTLDPVRIAPGRLVALQSKDAKRFHDLTDLWRKGESFAAFGPKPATGDEFYLGFSEALPQGETVSIFFTFAGTRSGEAERARIAQEARERKLLCSPPPAVLCREAKESAPSEREETEIILPPRRVRTEWEALVEEGSSQTWVRLEPERNEVDDTTRDLTLDGPVFFNLPALMAQRAVGQVAAPLYYLRCRFEAGAFDSPPLIRSVAMNGVVAEQSVPVSTEWVINKGTVPTGLEPVPGARVGFLGLGFDTRGITSIIFEADAARAPQFAVLDYRRATVTVNGLLTIEAKLVGRGTGLPEQKLTLPDAPVEEASLKLYTLETYAWRKWTVRTDFDLSTRGDAHVLLDPTTGTLTFGDGNRGRMPPPGALVFATYRVTQAEDGNLGADTITELSDSPHNRASLSNFTLVKAQLERITNPVEAEGGARAETIEEAQGRAIELMSTPQRAVTLSDYERLAKETPGVQLARVAARANLHTGFQCWTAPGFVTVIILPNAPGPRPSPGRALRRAVASYLERRRIIGTRVQVVGPTYREVAVAATVRALTGMNTVALKERILGAIDEFLDPLKGGPEKTGWPFGRDVYRSEILQVIDEVVGVDHVVRLALIAEGCAPQCGNVCVRPTQLVAAGPHEIEIVGG